MSLPSHPFRGPLFMVLATCFYVVNDTMMKVATEALPPYQVLTMRGIAALLWGMPLLFLLGYRVSLPLMFERRVLARNLCETGGILCFVVALANMPIADATALGQITPLVVLLGAALVFGEKIPGFAMALICAGFAGALMIARPSGEGISVYALLAIANAVLCAVRDLAGRRIAGHVPGMIVAMSAVVVVLIAAAIMHLAFEQWRAPDTQHVLLLAGSGLFLIFGHFFIFMAYRVGPTSAVAPFYYCFTVWAVVSGVVVFGHLPDLAALCGIVLVVGSGLAIVLHDRRRRRLAPVA
ncbi:DMT family transporter [Mesorhizobium sp. LHD-90]|uniref:DMT family transporter n=1 Tax=Mesorhizobium sp. LHD-90 TaxID=3071414 RepID=UPI0027E03178|nr:DMT family transporter [Mesorhizobium sp. LHD-90]MDQ6432619.1 DMT family transporter [Mesorhizobium sp. LHD-90]